MRIGAKSEVGGQGGRCRRCPASSKQTDAAITPLAMLKWAGCFLTTPKLQCLGRAQAGVKRWLRSPCGWFSTAKPEKRTSGSTSSRRGRASLRAREAAPKGDRQAPVLQPNELGDVVVKRGRETAPLKPQETPAAPTEEPVANKFEAFRSAADASPRSWKGSDLSTGRAPARSLVNNVDASLRQSGYCFRRGPLV